MLEFRDFKVDLFKKGNFLVNGKVSSEEKIVLEGPTGCGKSTLLKTIAGFYLSSPGTLFLNGIDISQLSVQKRKIAFVFQNPVFFSHLNVWENIKVPLDHQNEFKHWSFDLKKDRVFEFLKRFEISDLSERSTRDLSGGEKQRVSLARALIYKPDLLLMDEPVSALDVDTKERILSWISKVVSEMTCPVLTVNHIPEDSSKLGGRLVRWPSGSNICVTF